MQGPCKAAAEHCDMTRKVAERIVDLPGLLHSEWMIKSFGTDAKLKQ